MEFERKYLISNERYSIKRPRPIPLGEWSIAQNTTAQNTGQHQKLGLANTYFVLLIMFDLFKFHVYLKKIQVQH
jgi:hypothetical protein